MTSAEKAEQIEIRFIQQKNDLEKKRAEITKTVADFQEIQQISKRVEHD